MTDKEILNAILYRLDEMDADIKTMKEDVAEIKGRLDRIEKSLVKMDTRLEFLGVKWMEHDEKIFELKHIQAGIKENQ